MELAKARDLLMQTQLKAYINKIGEDQWIEVYRNEGIGKLAIFCAFIPKDKLSLSLSDTAWDFSITNGLPSCSTSSNSGGEDIVSYERYGNRNEIEPLIIVRDWHEIKESYYEISEEFRHFHNLYHDKRNGKFIYINGEGNEEEVIICEKNKILIKQKFIKRFLAIKEMYLAIFFENVVYSHYSLEELEIEEKDEEFKSVDTYYENFIRKNELGFNDKEKSVSRLLGKKIISGYPKEKSGIWPYNKNEGKKYVEFIIGECKETGEDLLAPCNPYGNEQYLTPVYFKKEVLGKYYADHSKYIVSDSYLSCGSLWGLKLDNNHEEYINVYLGDLGSSLSEEEQQYWRSFNVNIKAGISAVKFKRDFLVEFTEPTNKATLFMHKFFEIQKLWKRKYNWSLFKELHLDDQYHYKTIRVPLTNNDSEFDEQVRGLVKIIIDSLNENELKKHFDEDIKFGINLLEKFLNSQEFKGYEEHIKFLRNLQELRSTSVAHRKSKNYEKMAKIFELEVKDRIKVFQDIFDKMNNFLDYLLINLSDSSDI